MDQVDEMGEVDDLFPYYQPAEVGSLNAPALVEESRQAALP